MQRKPGLVFGSWNTLFVLSLVLIAGCAHQTPVAENAAPAATAESTETDLAATSTETIDPTPKAPEPPNPEKLGEYKKGIRIQLDYAEIQLRKVPRRTPGKLEVKVLSGGENCKVHLEEVDEKLYILEQGQSFLAHTQSQTTVTPEVAVNEHPVAPGEVSFSPAAQILREGGQSATSKSEYFHSGLACHYQIALAVRTTPAEFVLKQGSIDVENWDHEIQARMDWGEMNLLNVGGLQVLCGECTLTGERVHGKVRFDIQKGNIGLDGLEDSVQGRTQGDLVLKWAKISRSSEVKIHSLAGDVILAIPGRVPLAMDLQVPRGEVYSKFLPSSFGVPVSINAEQGNIRLLKR